MESTALNVLVVDDDPDMRRQCRIVLESEGMTVETAENGLAALEKVGLQSYDLALVDLMMPEVGGMELLARLQHTRPGLGIVIMTAHPSSQTAVEAMQCGALDYIGKPIKPDELLATVARALEASQRRDQERQSQAVPQPAGDMAPAAVADALAERVSVAKATVPWINIGVLGVLAGAYIGFGAALATVVTSDAAQYVGFGMSRVVGGLVFCVGLVLVVIAGAELFTGNNLMITGALGGQVGFGHMLLRWTVVYAANFLGSLLLASLMFGSGLWHMNGDAVGLTALGIANAKVNLGFLEAFLRAVGCNWLVCLAVWMSVGAQRVSGKVLVIAFPITAFVALGYEHCVANMYFVPMGILLSDTPMGMGSGLDLSNLHWLGFLVKNLVPVTLGNIAGGAIFVGVLYWAAYLRKAMQPA